MMIRAEFSGERLFQGWFQSCQNYGFFMVFILFSLTQFSPSHPQTLFLSPELFCYLFYGISLLLISLSSSPLIENDRRDGYLDFLIVTNTFHRPVLRQYFFSKLIALYTLTCLPLLCMTAIAFLISGEMTHFGWAYFLSLALSLGILCCWRQTILFLFCGQNSSSPVYFLSFLLVPFLVPSFLIGCECIKSIAAGEFSGYYIGMQLGLFLITLSMNLALAPLVLNQVESS